MVDQSSLHSRDFHLPSDLKGFRCSVLGLARSGLALAKVLIPKGAKVFLSDSRSADLLTAAQAEAQALGAEVETGGHTSRLLDCDCLIISPGVSVHAEIVQRAIAQGVPVVSEVEIAHHLCPWPMVAITGTNGKSTTCSLVQQFLSTKSFLAGNIGLPMVSEVEQHRSDLAIEWAVVEVSSFQLETVHRFAPRVAVLTNITPDHLDRHRTVEEYSNAKARIFAQQTASDLAIINLDDPLARAQYDLLLSGQKSSWIAGFPSPDPSIPKVYGYSSRSGQDVVEGCFFQDGQIWYRSQGQSDLALMAWDFENLPGPHNLSNAVAAVLVGHLLSVPVGQMRQTLASYGRLHHRLEMVAEINGVRFVDDSKATNISSVEAALQTFGNATVLIAGGRDKGLDMPLLGRVIAEHAHHLVAIGEAANQITQHAIQAGMKADRIVQASSMQDAVTQAFRLCPSPGVVLLSPACTSFDMFSNAEHRGQVFAQSVRDLPEMKKPSSPQQNLLGRQEEVV